MSASNPFGSTEAVRPRVLIVSLFHPDIVKGGAQRVAYDVFCGLRNAGVDASLLASVMDNVAPALYKPGAWITGFDGKSNEFVFLQRDYDFFWHRARNSHAVERFRDFLLWLKPDIVHFHHFFTFGMDIFPLVKATLPSCRVVLTLHEFLAICYADGQMRRKTDGSLCSAGSSWRCHQCFPDIGPDQFFVRKRFFLDCLNNVDAFVAPTNFLANRYVDWGLSSRSITTISNPDTAPRQHFPLPSETRMSTQGPSVRFGFFGQLVDNKGVDVLLGAASMLLPDLRGRFEIDINGGNEKFASAEMRTLYDEARHADSDLKGTVFFNGEYDEEQLLRRMQVVDVVVVPSTWWEIFALVVTEAWRYGRPVLCSHIGGLAERVVNGVGGRTFSVGSIRELADEMRRLILNPNEIIELRDTIPVVPQLDSVIDAHLNLYASALLRNGSDSGAEPRVLMRSNK